MRRCWPLLAVLIAGPVCAQEALYGAQPPHGSAFVRFVNATGAAVELHPGFLADRSLGTDGAARVSPYAVVEKVAGRSLALEIRQGGQAVQAVLAVAPDSFATVLVREDAAARPAASVVVDGADFNQARARLSFYNATPGCAAGSLALAPAGTVVFADVAPGGSRSRSVNPVKALVRGSCTGQAAEVMLEGMEVGSSYSVWLMLPGGAPAMFVTRDTTLPYSK